MSRDFIISMASSLGYKEIYAFYWKYGTTAARTAYNKNGVKIDISELETMQAIGEGNFQGVKAKKTGRFLSLVNDTGAFDLKKERVVEGEYIASITGKTDKVYNIFVLAE